MKLRRRPSFWLGLFVACFLAWAWWYSYRQEVSLFLLGKNKQAQILRAEGATYIVFRDEDWLSASTGVIVERRETGSKVVAEYDWAIAEARVWQLPDFLVFFSFVIPWSAWLFWRWKREQKKLAP